MIYKDVTEDRYFGLLPMSSISIESVFPTAVEFRLCQRVANAGDTLFQPAHESRAIGRLEPGPLS